MNNLVTAIALGFVAALAACAGDHRDSRVEPRPVERKATTRPQIAKRQTSDFVALPCPSATEGTGTPADMTLRATDLRLSAEVDYLAIREALPNERKVLGQRGTACSRATDRDGCQKALAALDAQIAEPPKRECLAQVCTGTVYVVTTHNDQASLYRTADEVLRLLGLIDGPREAWLIAQMTLGASVYACGDAELSAYRLVSDGYELRERVYTRACNPVEKTERIYQVNNTAQRKVLQKLLSSEPWCMGGLMVQPANAH